MSQPMFRKAALEQLASPDQLLRVTTPKGWIGLGAISALLIAAIIWGIAGRIATTVTGQGILLQGGRVYGVVSPIAGEVTALFVKVGDTVREGQDVAIITPPNSVNSSQITRVTSSYNGRVIELRAERGSIVVPSDTIMSLEATDLPLEVADYRS